MLFRSYQVLKIEDTVPAPSTLALHLPRLKIIHRGFPGGAVVKDPPANAGDTGSSPGPGRSHMPRSN